MYESQFAHFSAKYQDMEETVQLQTEQLEAAIEEKLRLVQEIQMLKAEQRMHSEQVITRTRASSVADQRQSPALAVGTFRDELSDVPPQFGGIAQPEADDDGDEDVARGNTVVGRKHARSESLELAPDRNSLKRPRTIPQDTTSPTEAFNADDPGAESDSDGCFEDAMSTIYNEDVVPEQDTLAMDGGPASDADDESQKDHAEQIPDLETPEGKGALVRSWLFLAWDYTAEEEQSILSYFVGLFSAAKPGKLIDTVLAEIEKHCADSATPGPGHCLFGKIAHRQTGRPEVMTQKSCKYCRGQQLCIWARRARGLDPTDVTGKVNLDGQRVRWIIKKRRLQKSEDLETPWTLNGVQV